ncbi:hypothetical protein FK530_22555 [Tsukamurella conjunctivitidis]|uniref:Uncharacterized protein n=1 Tax=Tsukamurella conjunctivitidis TaxID=2592068 RepID=A0A5C5RTR7_9ACTN|nr:MULTISPECIES: hypothetical protein [Tsukamurella]RDB48054.1 hypothetical protein DVB87_10025 [Tsukamurella tyrosinosolvens]TWS25621.1 hypothetical protein FK530_22555 [Tsukamurella conjunctivitidis]
MENPVTLIGTLITVVVLLADFWFAFFVTQRSIRPPEERHGQMVSAAAFYPAMTVFGVGFAVWVQPTPLTPIAAVAFYGAHAVVAVGVFLTVTFRRRRNGASL